MRLKARAEKRRKNLKHGLVIGSSKEGVFRTSGVVDSRNKNSFLGSSKNGDNSGASRRGENGRKHEESFVYNVGSGGEEAGDRDFIEDLRKSCLVKAPEESGALVNKPTDAREDVNKTVVHDHVLPKSYVKYY